MIGAETRLAICLGLLQNQSQYDGGIPSIKQSVLDRPKDDTDREERRATMYYALCYDVTTSASSGWVGTMPTEELVRICQITFYTWAKCAQTANLPAARVDFDKGVSTSGRGLANN